MKNTDIFTSGGYDMVVAVTQKSINDQIAHLANPDIGTINTKYAFLRYSLLHSGQIANVKNAASSSI